MAFRSVAAAQGECPVCYSELGNDAVIHSDGGEKHPIHRPCLQLWMKTQEKKGQAASCPLCLVNVTSIEPIMEAFLRAANEGSLEAVRAWMTDEQCAVYYGFALRGAAKNGHDRVVEVLLSHSKASMGGNRGWALEEAAEHGHEKVVKLLLSTRENNWEQIPSSSLERAWTLARNNQHEAVKALLFVVASSPTPLELEEAIQKTAGSVARLAVPTILGMRQGYQPLQQQAIPYAAYGLHRSVPTGYW